MPGNEDPESEKQGQEGQTNLETPGKSTDGKESSGGNADQPGANPISPTSEEKADNYKKTINAIDASGVKTLLVGDHGVAITAESVHLELPENLIDQVKKIPFIEEALKNKKTETTELVLHEITSDLRSKVRAVYVPSKDYENALKRLILPEKADAERILIIFGPDHSGKFASAICFGIDLQQADEVVQRKIIDYRRSRQDYRPLVDVFYSDETYKQISADHSPQPSVFIIRDAFENGVSISDLGQNESLAIQRKLREHQSYLILTTDCEEEKLTETPVFKITLNLAPNQMEQVFERHQKWYSEQGNNTNSVFFKTCQDKASRLSTELRNAFKIDAFFERGAREFDQMVQDALDASEDRRDFLDREEKEREELLDVQVERLARKIKTLGQEPTRPWFKQLSENERLYAMLAVLFSGVAIQVIDTIYDQLVRKLRSDGVATLADSRELGREDILFAIRARAGKEDLIYFDNTIYIQEVWEQINNRHSLLWSLVEILVEWINDYKGPEYWELRRAFGIAIGRLGIHRQLLLEIVLDRLAEDESGGVVAVAGYALDGICQLGPDYYSFVNSVLEKWVNSGDPDFTWAASASIWRVYDTLFEAAQLKGESGVKAQKTLENIDQNLTHLAESFDIFGKGGRAKAFEYARQAENFEKLKREDQIKLLNEKMIDRYISFAAANLDSILYAIRKMWLTKANRVVDLLCKWLKFSDGSRLKFFGVNAAVNLFRETSDPRQILIEDRHGPLLKLAGSLLEESPDTADEILRILASWLNQDRWSPVSQGISWPEKVQAELLQAINHQNPSKLSWVRFGLISYWLGGETQEVQRFGWSLLTRTYVIAGQPVLLPGLANAGFALDASRMSEISDRSEFGRGMSERTAARLSTYAFMLGKTKPVLSPSQSNGETRMLHRKNYPRLVMPSIEWLHQNYGGDLLFFMILAWDNVVDIEDLDGEKQQIILAQLKPENEDTGIVKPPPPYSIMHPNENTAEEFRKMVEERIDFELAGYLTGLEESKLAKILTLEAGFPAEDLDKVVAWLDQRTQEADATVLAQQGTCDALRLLVNGIIWLSKVDFSRCINLLCSWMGEIEKSTRRRLGEASSRLLIHIYSHPSSSINQEKASDERRLICKLGSALLATSHDRYTLNTVLTAIHRWLNFTFWSNLLLDRDIPGKDSKNTAVSLLADLVDKACTQDQAFLEKTLEDWLAEEKAPDDIRQIAQWLLIRLAFRQRKYLSDPGEEHKYAIILLDSSRTGNQFLAETALDFAHELADRSMLHLSFETLIFRLGETIPAAIWPQSPNPESLISSVDCRRSLLAAPILDLFPLEKTAFILCLTNGKILDLDEWIEDWQKVPKLLFSYGTLPPVFPDAFTTIIYQKSPDEEFKPPVAARAIINQLFTILK